MLLSKPKKKIIAVVGPTASGKTALSIALAKRFSGEVVSCDSMQIYRGMDIGTAKPDLIERDGIPHHLIDICDPDMPFSCADYIEAAEVAVSAITARGRIPIFCGGTGLYVDSFLQSTSLSPVKADPEIRKKLQGEADARGTEYLHSKLNTVDPASAAAIHPNNRVRIIRALEIFETTGKTKSQWDDESHASASVFDVCWIGLAYEDRAVLHDRIRSRVMRMMEQGFADEVSELLKCGYLKEGSTAAQAIGYREMAACLRGELTIKETIEKITVATRQYAKRQLTWFRRNPCICWIYPDMLKTPEEIVSMAVAYCLEHLNSSS